MHMYNRYYVIGIYKLTSSIANTTDTKYNNTIIFCLLPYFSILSSILWFSCRKIKFEVLVSRNILGIKVTYCKKSQESLKIPLFQKVPNHFL